MAVLQAFSNTCKMCKKGALIFRLIACLSLAGVTNCETDFNPGMTGQVIPVIFGLIDYDDSVYQVSITKSYLPEGSAQKSYGSKPDIYFDTLIVSLELRYDPEAPRLGSYVDELWRSTFKPYGELIIRKEMQATQIVDPSDGSPKQVYTLAASEFVKYGGFGTGDNQFLFLRLVVFRPGSEIYTIASTRLCEIPYLMSLGTGTSMSLYDNMVEWSWDSHGNYGEPKIFLHYEEFQDGEWVKKELTWNFGPVEEKVFTGDKGSTFIYYSGHPFTESILMHIGGRIKDNPDVEARKLSSFDLVIFNADPIFGKYLESDKIVSDHAGRPISNVSNGLGIFASTSKTGRYGFTLDRRSLDSLVNGKYTRHLKFVKW
jgi:hypothetical protein